MTDPRHRTQTRVPAAQASAGGAAQPVCTPAELLQEGVRRARALGWRTITVSRLIRLAAGDKTALPPDPRTAPPSAFGTYRPRT